MRVIVLVTAQRYSALATDLSGEVLRRVALGGAGRWRHASPFYGYNRPGAKISEGVRESFWLQGMLAGFPAAYFCIKAFSETDFTDDLKKFDVPTLILHGDDDQIVPIQAAGLLSSKLVKGAEFKIYKGAPHGMCTTLKDEVNADLLSFIKK
jgi:non-heme chloroperoxidase